MANATKYHNQLTPVRQENACLYIGANMMMLTEEERKKSGRTVAVILIKTTKIATMKTN